MIYSEAIAIRQRNDRIADLPRRQHKSPSSPLLKALVHIYRPGHAYSKCAILLMDLSQRGEVILDLLAPQLRPGSYRLMKVIGIINQREGRGTVRLRLISAAPVWAMRRDMKSQLFTTRWYELLAIRG